MMASEEIAMKKVFPIGLFFFLSKNFSLPPIFCALSRLTACHSALLSCFPLAFDLEQRDAAGSRSSGTEEKDSQVMEDIHFLHQEFDTGDLRRSISSKERKRSGKRQERQESLFLVSAFW